MTDIDYFWSADVWEQLLAARRQGRLPHALLLDGPRGLGKDALARRLARLVLCEGSADAACERCRPCELSASGTHPDIVTLSPEEDKSTIGVDQVRALIGGLTLRSHGGGYKVAIVTPADSLTVSAANSLLKTLEEPTPDTLMMLVSEQMTRLPPTIRSRCQRLRINPPARDEALSWLAALDSGVDWEPALDLAGGAPLEAQRLAAAGQAGLGRQLAGDLADVASGQAEPVAVAARWAALEHRYCVGWLHGQVARLIKYRLLGAKPGTDHGNPGAHLQTYADRLDLIDLFGYSDQVRAAAGLLETQANQRMIFESLLLPWANRLRALD